MGSAAPPSSLPFRLPLTTPRPNAVRAAVVGRWPLALWQRREGRQGDVATLSPLSSPHTPPYNTPPLLFSPSCAVWSMEQTQNVAENGLLPLPPVTAAAMPSQPLW